MGHSSEVPLKSLYHRYFDVICIGLLRPYAANNGKGDDNPKHGCL